MFTRNQFNWLVGFYEGEGSCGVYLYNRYKYLNLVVSISQKDKSILLWIKRKLGYGGIYQETFNKKCYRWQCYGTNALNFLLLIKPHLKLKYRKEQLNNAIIKYNAVK